MNRSGKIRVLFVCVGNSARSQMAEGWARALKSDAVEAFSAGSEPAGLNPLAIAAMSEAGVDISGQRSKSVMEYIDRQFDYVVTMCDEAAGGCPVFPGEGKVVHREFPDPAAARGATDEKLTVFREVRDEIKTFVEEMPGSLERLEQQ
jgi:arsenate reductase